VAPWVPLVGGEIVEHLFRLVPYRLPVTVSRIGVAAVRVPILARTIPLQSQCADPSRRGLLSLIINITKIARGGPRFPSTTTASLYYSPCVNSPPTRPTDAWPGQKPSKGVADGAALMSASTQRPGRWLPVPPPTHNLGLLRNLD